MDEHSSATACILSLFYHRTDSVVVVEILLLLEALTHGNPQIQQIVAFNEGFDKLLRVCMEAREKDLRKEKGNYGVLMEDCLRLINNLLKRNTNVQVTLTLAYCVMRCADVAAVRRCLWIMWCMWPLSSSYRKANNAVTCYC